MKLSIIVPIYNESEEELHRCLGSVSGMNIEEGYEVLLIDNNSEESVAAFLKEYCMLQAEFRYILETTQGVSAARNRGIQEASGEYIAFLDADDCMIQETVENYFQKEVDADQIIFNQRGNTENVVAFPDESEGIKKWNSVVLRKLTTNFPAFYAAFYRREFLLSHGVVFPMGVRIGEDDCFSFTLWKEKPVIYYINRDVYFYNFKVTSRKKRYLDDPYGAMEDLRFEHRFKSELVSQLELSCGEREEIILLLNRRLVSSLFSELLYLYESKKDSRELKRNIRQIYGEMEIRRIHGIKLYIEFQIIVHNLWFLFPPICLARKLSQRIRGVS